MRHRLLLALLLTPALGGSLAAQWTSTPHDPLKALTAQNWFVAHDTASGIQAFSAIAQTWTTVSPPGSTMAAYVDSVLLDAEAGNVVRGWSAYRNASATQSVSPGYALLVPSQPRNAFVALQDFAPSTNGVLRAYSSYTNTWASAALSAVPSTSLAMGTNVAVQRDGLHYRAYSAYTGQWSTLDVAVAGGTPFAGVDYAAVDLRGTAGPFQYAAFSAPRGTWTLSPVYPTGGAGLISYPTASVLAIQTPGSVAGTFRYAGYSPYTGQWTTSSLVHAASSTQTALARWNLVRVLDTDVNARVEIFGAGNGIWQALTGPNLVEDSLHEDFDVMRDATISSTVVYAASALVGGGWTSITVPMFVPSVSQGSHCCTVTGGNDPFTNAIWGYSAATNAFVGPVAEPSASGVSTSAASAVYGFAVQGSSSSGTSAHAFSARWGNWVASPAVAPVESWSMHAAGSILFAQRSNGPTNDYFVFDEHRNAWLAPIAGAPVSWNLGPNCFAYSNGAGTYTAYSAQRGDWSTQSGIGAITSVGGFVPEHLAWFTDSNHVLWVFPTPDRAQTWFPWPLAPAFASSGTTPGGSPPFEGVSVRGAPATELALLYAALALAPAPLPVPGLCGLLDLDPAGAFFVANLGLFDADGVRELQIPLASPIPGGTQAWFQAVTFDLLSSQICLAGRATAARVF